MSQNYAETMIKKMIASIMYQAKNEADRLEKLANEDADRQRNSYVNAQKTKLEEEVKNQTKAIKNQKSIKLSIANGKFKMKVLKVKDEAVNMAMTKAQERLNEFVKTSEYPDLLYKLILQSLLILREPVVDIAVVKDDGQKVQARLDEIASDYKKRTQSDIQLSVSDYVLPPAAIGGCVAIAKEGKIQCSNTLMDRLDLSCKDLYPKIRAIFEED